VWDFDKFVPWSGEQREGFGSYFDRPWFTSTRPLVHDARCQHFDQEPHVFFAFSGLVGNGPKRLMD
jgi:hypothetical protein